MTPCGATHNYRKPKIISYRRTKQSHAGKVNNTRLGVRMCGEGNIAQKLSPQYKKYELLYNMNAEELSLDKSIF